MNKNTKTVYTCQTCGYETPKWMGKCPDCGEWQSFVEEAKTSKRAPGFAGKSVATSAEVIAVSAIDSQDDARILTGLKELDRVLGGGLVPGTLILIGGDPGIGKSTLMLQALHGLSQDGQKVLYVSGEESVRQLGLRSKRLSTLSADILAVSEIEMDAILAIIEKNRPGVIVIDSIQTMYSGDLTSAPGSVSQVRECAMRLMLMAKHKGIPTFLVGHVTKDGSIAGPRLLEHMVDTVLYFEGDRNHVFRILRAVKNRFGSTNEIGVFEMKENGLNEVANPSAIFLSERPEGSPGSVVTSSMEGTRPILVELQALASSTTLGTPRRTILGLDQNRVALLVAVMEKKLGMHLLAHDIFMNVAGGVRIDEPGVDLGIVSAIASSFLDKPVMDGTAVVGEVGLTGEVRAVGQIETRASEMKKMGFTRCLVPRNNLERMATLKGLDLVGVRNISEAVEALF